MVKLRILALVLNSDLEPQEQSKINGGVNFLGSDQDIDSSGRKSSVNILHLDSRDNGLKVNQIIDPGSHHTFINGADERVVNTVWGGDVTQHIIHSS